MDKKPLDTLANAKNFSLTREEKKSLRQELMADMTLMKEMFPRRLAGDATRGIADLSTAELWQGRSKLLMRIRKESQPVREIPTINVIASFLQEMTRSLSPVFALFVVLAGVSTAISAEQAVPGDPLYAVKIYITEPIRGGLHFFPKAQAEWDVKLLERRLEEVEIVAGTETLSPYAERVNRHIQQIVNEIQISIDMEPNSEAQQEIKGMVYSVMVDHQDAVRSIVRNEKERTYMRALIQKLDQRDQPQMVGSFRENSVQFLDEDEPIEKTLSGTAASSAGATSSAVPVTPVGPAKNSIINRTMRKLQRQSDDRLNSLEQ